jgi:hypothetical protein
MTFSLTASWLQTVEVESCINQGNKYHAANYTAKGVVDMTKLIWAFVDTKDDASSTPPKVTVAAGPYSIVE